MLDQRISCFRCTGYRMCVVHKCDYETFYETKCNKPIATSVIYCNGKHAILKQELRIRLMSSVLSEEIEMKFGMNSSGILKMLLF